MSKEYLEAFEVITGDNYHCDEETFYHNRAIVEQALQRLEAIDNSNPSEALECVEALKEDGCITTLYQGKALETIRQALLKEQEPKQYLKWEDLEWEELKTIVKKEIKVKLNGVEYGLEFTINYGIKEVSIFDEKNFLYVVFNESHKQFFNDLHLERVEE